MNCTVLSHVGKYLRRLVCCCSISKLCLTLLRLHGLCSPPCSSVHGISQARILEWGASFSSRGSSRPRDQMHVSCIVGGFLTAEPPGNPTPYLHLHNLSTIPCMPNTADTRAETNPMKPGGAQDVLSAACTVN